MPDRISASVPCWMQTVQRAEYCGVILALQTLIRVHLGIDHKNVSDNEGRLVAGWSGSPLCLCTGGDLPTCIFRMLQYRLQGSVKVSQVKGHATDATVTDGTVRREDKEGNDSAHIAADFGRPATTRGGCSRTAQGVKRGATVLHNPMTPFYGVT